MHKNIRTLLSFVLVLCFFSTYGQEQATDPAESEDEQQEIEEVVAIGTQIRGADVTEILPVAVIDEEVIEALGVDSGDELFDLMPEQGQNLFNEEENISGGVNSARGDIGAFNLRNLGTGNTLVLLNGRRMVNASGYQTEEIGGSFVPVNTVNSNHVPVFGIRRVELLKDGASAIYGADAVAGVVNNVLKDDIDRFRIRSRVSWYENVSRKTHEFNMEWGRDFNDGRTNVAVMLDTQSRDPIHSSEDPRWADSDLRRLIPDGSPWEGNTSFRNTSANSLFGQYDVVSSVRRLDIRNTLTDTAGEFETYPSGHPNCDWQINETTCAARDGNGTYRYNINEFRDLSSRRERNTVFVFINHALANGSETFTEWMYYNADSRLSRHPSAPFSSVKLRVDAENYYNPFGPCGSPNRLPESVIGNIPCSGLTLEIDNYRFAQVPRIVNNSDGAFRFLQGIRGTRGSWDWETAVLYSEAISEDVTNNRVSNTLMSEALRDPTPAAYNPFSGGIDSNIERALVDVRRDSKATLFLVDFKASSFDLFQFGSESAAGLMGAEFRRETFVDDRDPRLDGTIVFTDFQGDTYPLVSDVVNSSPTPDNKGDRTVASLFGELQIPITDRIDTQIALRYENFSDVEDTVVGKFAAGWRIFDQLLLRASWSQSFRAPNLVTINENVVARQNTRNDYVCVYASLEGGDPDQDIVDCRNSTQRVARGSDFLVPESSDNISAGIVIEPTDDLVVTLDYWSIDKEGTIGLFGEENHTVWDLYLRLQQGNANCANINPNPVITRLDLTDDDAIAVYEAAGICPVGDVIRVNDLYANLDRRLLEGLDFAIYHETSGNWGRLNTRLMVSHTAEFNQEASGRAAELLAARESGLLPVSIPIGGFANLIHMNGNQDLKATLVSTWRKGSFGISGTAAYLGDFYQNSLTLDDGTPDGLRYWVGSHFRMNLRFEYYRELSDAIDARWRLGVQNIANERAPLADRYFGFFSDAHRDYGRNYYLDLRLSFD